MPIYRGCPEGPTFSKPSTLSRPTAVSVLGLYEPSFVVPQRERCIHGPLQKWLDNIFGLADGAPKHGCREIVIYICIWLTKGAQCDRRRTDMHSQASAMHFPNVYHLQPNLCLRPHSSSKGRHVLQSLRSACRESVCGEHGQVYFIHLLAIRVTAYLLD